MQEIQEMQAQSLDKEDRLEEGMATYSSILAWETPWTEKPSGLQTTGVQRVRMTEHVYTYTQCVHINPKLLIYPFHLPFGLS